MHLPDARFKKRLEGLRLTTQEWHILIIGLGNGFCPWPPTYDMPHEDYTEMRNEYHYFMAGRALGFFLLLLYITTLIHILTG